MFKDIEYSVGDKFVIEIGKIIDDGAGYTTNANIIVDDEFFDKLDKLDSDYINEYYGHLQDEAYIAGMNEVWELTKKLFLNEKDGGIPDKDMDKIFGESWSVEDILHNTTAQEALKKIEDYKYGKVDKVSYGDIVRADGVNGIVLDNYNDYSWNVYTENGCVEVWTNFVKLGNRGQTLECIRLALAKEGVPDDEDM